MTISQRATDVRAVLKQANIGDLVYANRLTDEYTAANRDPQAKQVSTLTVGGPTGLPRNVSFIINGVTITYAAQGGDTTSDIAAGLKAAVDAEPAVGNAAVASVATNVVTLTGVIPGIAFTISESDTDLTLATPTAAATASAVQFGRALVNGGFDGSDRLASTADTSKFTAQVATATVAGLAAGDVLVCTVHYGGIAYPFSVAFDTDNNTTVGNMRTALAALPSGLTAGGATDTFSITADTAGDAFSVSASPGVTWAGNIVPSAATSLELAFAGLSKRVYEEELPTVNATAGEYPPNAGVLILRKNNSMWVENSESPSSGSAVYVDLTPGSGAGKMYATSGSGRVKVSTSLLMWERGSNTSTDNIAAVRVAA